MFEWPLNVSVSGDNLYSFPFETNWEKVQSELKVGHDARLHSFEVEYSQNGLIDEMMLEVVSSLQNKFIHYRLSYHPDKKIFTVRRQRLKEPWLQYNQMIQVSRFFSALDTLDLNKIKPEHHYPWYSLTSEGTRTSYAVLDSEKYVITDKKITPVKNYELPIEGFFLESCGKNEKATQMGGGCQESAHYFFDASYKKKEDGPFTYEEAIAVLRGNEKVNNWIDRHLGSNVRQERNGKYYLMQQGQWQEVPEEKYRKKVEPFQLKHELRDQQWIITYEALLGDPPFILEGIVDENTGEILSIKMID